MIFDMRGVAAALCGFAAWASASAAPCDGLAALTIPNVKIASAATMISGPSVLPGENTGLEKSLPEFCKVDAVADSETKIEVWLPTEDQWNGRFLGTDAGAMEPGVRQGYAVARTKNGDVHVMRETAAAIVKSFYGRAAEHSYFAGCSIRDVKALAERYPGDFDGILAGEPERLPDLRAFERRGGKLLAYEGSANSVVPPKASAGFFRLFLVPGLGHCGDGPATFDPLRALDKWVSDGVAPETTLNRSTARRIR
jgi:hypothetical protein